MFQKRDDERWCDDRCFAENEEDCCQSRSSAIFWTLFLLFLLCMTCGVLACCFFCEQCPLYQHYAEHDDGSGIFLAPAVQHVDIVYGSVQPGSTTPNPIQAHPATNEPKVQRPPAPDNDPPPHDPKAQEMQTFQPGQGPASQVGSRYEDAIL
eukprot:TRINITY_DN2022_c0_g1_i1.p1 TRINITY_DN2022_c0_g1~~TRINITY_DN2022_c0_g1_i1.p1  ORF type:complete len:152 (+),score=22.71 TRINITY_DN2022_c0_g1_i1:391-846(+)